MIRIAIKPRSVLRDESGATMVEYALVAPVLIFLLLSIIELGVLAMISSGLDNTVFQLSRRIRTGRADAPASAIQFKQQICAEFGTMLPDCQARLRVGVERFARFADANLQAAEAPEDEYNRGGPGDIIVVKVDYEWPLVTPFITAAYRQNGPTRVTISSRTAFKNEPYA